MTGKNKSAADRCFKSKNTSKFTASAGAHHYIHGCSDPSTGKTYYGERKKRKGKKSKGIKK